MSEHVQEVSGAEFSQEVLEAPGPVLVDFWAPWCGPCKMLSPVLEEVAQDLANQVKVVKVNVDDNRELAGQFRIMSVPTLMLVADGKEVTRLTGFMAKDDLVAKLQNHLNA